MAWVYTYGVTTYTDGTSNQGWSPHTFSYGGRVTFASAGTIDQLSAYAAEGQGGPRSIKNAIYDTSGNLLVDGGLLDFNDAAQAWRDTPTFTATSVSAADYFILTSGEQSETYYGWNSGEDGSYATAAYADFPESTETITAEGDTGQGYGRRANFTASSSDRDITATLATLDITSANATINATRELTATAASLSIAAANATIKQTRNITAALASLSLSSANAGINATRSIAATAASLGLTAYSSSVSKGLGVQAGLATLSLATSAASVNRTREIAAALATLGLTSYVATVTQGNNLDISASLATLSIASNAATANLTREIAATSASLNLASHNATMEKARNIAATRVTLTLSTPQATVEGPAGFMDGYFTEGEWFQRRRKLVRRGRAPKGWDI